MRPPAPGLSANLRPPPDSISDNGTSVLEKFVFQPRVEKRRPESDTAVGMGAGVGAAGAGVGEKDARVADGASVGGFAGGAEQAMSAIAAASGKVTQSDL